MKSEFVPYELALRMKALGFDEPCFAYFLNSILQYPAWEKDYSYFNEMSDINPSLKKREHVLAPTWQSAFRWFQKFRLFANVYYVTASGWKNGVAPEDWKPCFNWVIKKPIGVIYSPKTHNLVYNEQEANRACLENLIEIVESKTK